ncbi:MAG: hypothetical protein P4L43_01440, partial [Syntrophobacteraceae bacterium]|nr:hypothetical protein [Syntrophobacteraceae bacterium]
MGLETLPLSMATAGIVNPAFAGLAAKFPTLAAKIAPIVHDAVTFAAQGALEPDQPGEQAKWGAITGATLGAMAPYGRIARAVVGAGLGAGQEYAQNPQASIQDIEKNATLMATFGALSRAEGMNLSDTFYGTLWDWAQNKGILPDAFRRSLQMQGVGPIANQFADEMGSHPD